MDTRRIGSLEVSVVGLGCNNFGWRIDEARTREVVAAALEAGVTLFDTADMYGGTRSEEFLGRALAGRRDRAVIATKFGLRIDEARPGGGRAAYVRRAAEASLKRLGTDRIDLYQLHRPDPETPIEETLGAMGELVREGKVREIGCSNFSVAQLDQAAAQTAPGAPRFVSVQNEYSLLHREPERGVLDACGRLGLAFLPYFPLAGGLLTGKVRRGTPAPEGTRLHDAGAHWLTDANFDVVEALERLVRARERSLLDLAFSWLLARPEVASVIAGATSPAQIRANAAAASWRLSREDLVEIDAIAPPRG